ncbi:MAG: hypothetical protein AB7D05_08635 [Mangrovibacterium sp.]
MYVSPGIQGYAQNKVHIPAIEEVGALVMTEEIVPVKAPFAMPEFKKPVFPDDTLCITETGARGRCVINQSNSAGR